MNASSLLARLSFAQPFIFEVSVPAEIVAQRLLDMYVHSKGNNCDVQIIETVQGDYRFKFDVNHLVIATGNIFKHDGCARVQGQIKFETISTILGWLPLFFVFIIFFGISIGGWVFLSGVFQFWVFLCSGGFFPTFFLYRHWKSMFEDRRFLLEKMQHLLSTPTRKSLI